MIIVSGLSYAYKQESVLRFPDFTVEHGKSCLLLGESGSGKTTLLHLIGGLLKIQEGNIHVNGASMGELSESQLDHFRGQHIGFIFQKHHLISALTVRQNLLMAPFVSGMKQDEHRIEEVLAQLGLWEKKNTPVLELSQGQAQRVAIARAVINKPSVLIADEPTSALDDTNCDRVISLLMNVALQNHCTLVVATHDHRLSPVVNRQINLVNPS